MYNPGSFYHGMKPSSFYHGMAGHGAVPLNLATILALMIALMAVAIVASIAYGRRVRLNS